MPTPTWLPNKLGLNPIPKEIHNILDAVFIKDFVQGNLTFRGCPVWWNKKVTDEHQEGCWHLVSRHNKNIDERIVEIPRAEKLPWCAAVIKNAQSSDVVVFDHPEGDGHIRTYLWLQEHDYVVMLDKQVRNFGKKRIEVYFLVTAYHVDNEYTRNDLRKKLERSS